MLHDTPPRNGGTIEEWLGQVDSIMAGIKKKNLDIVPLAELIDRPVMGIEMQTLENEGRRASRSSSN
jgi:hypothetical protein